MSTPGADLWTRDELEEAIERGELADWKATRYRTFHETMTDDEGTPYPCYFAVEAEREGLFRYAFPGDPDDRDARAGLARGLEAYLEDYESIGEFSSLVVLFEPAGEQPPEAYKRQFWELLEWLGEADPEPWPETVPTDPDHPKWRYCFAGEPLFLVARAPFYGARRSRHTAHGLEITIQPSGVFEGLSGMSDDGQRARSTIRDRLAEYDDVSRHPDSGDYSDPRRREWKQYMLPETNEESVARCPLPERTR